MTAAEVTHQRSVGAPVEEVWAVLAAFGDLARWAPNVDHSCLLRDDEPGGGHVRRVQVGRDTLLETVIEWAPSRALAYDITGLPPILRSVRNRWQLTPTRGGTAVHLTTTVDAGSRPPQRVIARIAAWRLARRSEALLGGLAAAVTTAPTSGGTPVG